jgi:hypothetical protein
MRHIVYLVNIALHCTLVYNIVLFHETIEVKHFYTLLLKL